MVTVQPFAGLRYDAGQVGGLARVLAPPYDVVTPAEREALERRSPYNIIHVELPAGGGDRYERDVALLGRWRLGGALLQDAAPALYLLEERFDQAGRVRRRLGLLAAVPVLPWSSGAVLPHEHTMPGPKLDRLRLLQACRTNTSPIFLMHDDPGGRIRELLARATEAAPAATARLGPGDIPHAAAEHRLWVLDDAHRLADLAAAFGAAQAYIADGHHRYETALTYRAQQRAAHPANPDGPWDAALMFLVAVDDPGLVALPTHRLLRDLDPARLAALPSALAGLYDLERLPPALPLPAALDRLAEAGNGALLIAGLPGGLTLARPRGDLAARLPSERSAAWRSLDVSALHALVLEPLLGLGEEEIRGERHAQYTRDAAEALGAGARGAAQLAVLLNPTPPQQVCAVARARDRMPQKSTFFYPKPLTGWALYAHGT